MEVFYTIFCAVVAVEASKLSASLDSMGEAVGQVSLTTKSVFHPHGTATSWSSAQDTRPTILPAQTMSSPSPPLTTQSVSTFLNAYKICREKSVNADN